MTKITVDVYTIEGNQIKPNPLFHRSLDKLHSRCIEYPYAASKLANSKIILDIGSAKSDPIWLKYLSHINTLDGYEVHATDYENLEIGSIEFKKSDARHLPYDDNYFDLIYAVSVIEHIGLSYPQINDTNIPIISEIGDFEAFKEFLRVLKPGGKVVLTVPYSNSKNGLILGNSARCYDRKRLEKFNDYAEEEEIQFYEYTKEEEIQFYEHTAMYRLAKHRIYNLFSKIRNKICTNCDIPNAVTWEMKKQEHVRGLHKWHVDCVALGVWRKR